jgi:uncharacterized protein (TIGR01777 family)
MSRSLITGATGFLGRHLLRHLEEPVVLSRNADSARRNLAVDAVFQWDPAAGEPPAEALVGVRTVFHLAGESIAEGRWTTAKKNRIRDSRVIGTRNLVSALCRMDEKPEVLVSASAVGFYGDRGDDLLDESESPGDDFLSETCVAWERAAAPARQAGIRVVNPRIGIVLGPDGGAIPKLARLFRLGLGSPLGSGRQWMPWIHVDDLVNALLLAAARADLRGPVNAVAPNSATNREFTELLARALHRPTVLPPVPAFALRAALGGFADALLASQRVVPQQLLSAGFEFLYPELEQALRSSV